MRSLVLAVLVLLPTIAAPPAAWADHDEERIVVPQDAPVVAGPTAGGATMVAFDRGRDLCFLIRTPEAEPEQPECAAAPRLGEESIEDSVFVGGRGDQAVRGGVTIAATAEVEERFAGASAGGGASRRQRSVRTPAVAGEAYRGRAAGRVRFWLADAPALQPWLTRYVDAGGRAVFARTSPFERPAIGRPVDVARGRSGGRVWRLRATIRPALAPTPFERGRVVNEVCTGIVPSRSGDAVCLGRWPRTVDLEVHPQTECGRTGLVVATTPRVRRAVAVLGDGRRARIPLVDAPARLGLPATRLGGSVADGAIAIRRVEGFDARGRRVARSQLGMPPAAPCDPGAGSFSVFTFGEEVRADGPLRLSARDEGSRLCVALGDLDRAGRDCALPPTLVRESYVGVRRTAQGVLVGGAVAAEIVALEVRVDGRTERVATTEDVPGYGGQYRGAVRFASFVAPPSARVTSLRMMLADGRRLQRQPLYEEQEVVGRGRAFFRGRVTARLVTTRGGPFRGPCVQLSLYDADECGPVQDDFFFATAACAPRVLVVYGGVRRSTRRVELELRGGRRVPVGLLSAGGQKVFVAELPRDGRLVAIHVIGRVTRRADLALPPVSRQCGYQTIGIARLPEDR